MDYYANIDANNGTRLMNDRHDTNKRRLMTDIIAIAKAERCRGNIARWWICDANGNYVAESFIDDSGYHKL